MGEVRECQQLCWYCGQEEAAVKQYGYPVCEKCKSKVDPEEMERVVIESLRVGRLVSMQEIKDLDSFVLSVSGNQGLWVVGRGEDPLTWTAYCLGKRKEFMSYEDALVWVANELERKLVEVVKELEDKSDDLGNR